MMRTVSLADPVATEALGRALAAAAPASAVVYLHGELGAGKSVLARAILRALGVIGAVKSPTYTLVERYQLDDGDAAHLDLYRIADGAELEFLGLDELAGICLCLVEWPERGGSALPSPDLRIRLAVAGEGRSARIEAESPTGAGWLAALDRVASLTADFSGPAEE
jgi:tRNA threonylcarbamoyladenosine biosynthesis protein TsaE